MQGLGKQSGQAGVRARYNVTGARGGSPLKVFAMWCLWSTLLVASCALVAEGADIAQAPVPATTRAPPRTLDRQAAELAWRTWLQSPESGNQNAPPRRITTKSLFITPLVCPKGQRLDSNGCVQVVTVNKDEHERILLEQLNALFTSAPSGDVVYDYGDEEPGPLQLSIPIALEPQAAPFHAQEPSAQAQELKPNYVKVDKKEENKPDTAAGLVAELELLQLQHSQNSQNETASAETSDILNHNVLQALEKPKRDSPITNSTEIETDESAEGQKEVVYGHVNVDPVLYQDIETETEQTTIEIDTETPTDVTTEETTTTVATTTTDTKETTIKPLDDAIKTKTLNTTHTLTKDGDKSKLNPENEYADIGEAIKLISRYAEVTTDDNYGKDQKKLAAKDDNILGTRTKLQYRRNKPNAVGVSQEITPQLTSLENRKELMPVRYATAKKNAYYRYPWPGEQSPTPPPDYPFRHIQDYWPDRNKIGGLYNVGQENPRRHHHNYPHTYYRAHSMPYTNYPGPYFRSQEAYPGQPQESTHRLMPHHARPMRSHTNNQDLYTLLGLRHWFSSEGTSKR